ncbi:hypothetical protein KKC83_05495 [Patescibacteria group bacterium]|nr:hypothetical protein [Candidatus Falkowbacteria bacterium]MBU3906492.1 hypothetical protein [Patescibacteria group bacterium]MCG2698219.1 hypothetical protein [Candidatus Parcubacteria bacterium]MBU4015613.1 hypothetical protein [Patescibacteria group bacterium]MBU4026969.1 hypothetical protein [Patescibacteria group bacterium]
MKVEITYKGEKLFTDANSFCKSHYWKKEYLEKDKEFAGLPDIYFVVIKDNKIIATMAAAIKKESDKENLAFETIYSCHVDKSAAEIGRFSFTKEVLNKPKFGARITTILINSMVEFFNAPEYKDYNFFIETRDCLLRIVQFILGKNSLLKINAKADLEKVPEQSRCFYIKEDPKLYLINNTVVFN